MATRKQRPDARVRQLPPELREQLDSMLEGGKYSLTQITDHLRALGGAISRSAVGRYSQSFEQVGSDIRHLREMAQAIGQELADVEGDSGRMIIESLQALLLRVRMQMSDGDEIDPEQLNFLTRSAKDLQQALKANVETTIKARERALKDAAAAVVQHAKADGLSDEVVNVVKNRILGVRTK